MTKKDFEGTTVLITGASSGIGEAFARNLASKGVNLILTARSQDKLIRIADELRKKHPISVQVFPADLSRIDAPQQLIDQIRTSGSSVDVLINNAGFGKWAHFLAEDIDTYQRMLSLNINALVRLTYLCLPDMLSRGKGGVINVASTAAFQPGVSRILCKRGLGQCCGIRSSNWMVNRFRAAFQSRIGIVHFSLMFLSAR